MKKIKRSSIQCIKPGVIQLIFIFQSIFGRGKMLLKLELRKENYFKSMLI